MMKIMMNMNMNNMQTYEYGAVSSKYELQAPCHLTAYAAMILHYEDSARLLVIYSPEECKKDAWTTFGNDLMERVDKTFGGPGKFEAYIIDNKDEIITAYDTIKQLV